MPTYIEMPKLSDTMTEGVLVKWHKKAGDSVEIGDVLADVETDKATMEMEAFDDGVLHKLLVEEGAKVPIGENIAILLAEGEDAPSDDEKQTEPESGEKKSKKTEKSETSEKSASDTKESKSQDRARTESKERPKEKKSPGDTKLKASPLAKKLAKERGVSLEGVEGSGPGGRIVAKDVPDAGSRKEQDRTPATETNSHAGNGSKIPLSGMRRVIADRLLASKTQIPHFYLHIEVDAEPIMELRRQLNELAEASGEKKITINDFVLLAAARAAAAYPKVNATFAGDSIVQFRSVNLSVAVAVDDGLVTPVIRDAQDLSLREISSAVKDLAGRAREKKLKPEEYQGGTITVSNLGAYGIERFAAIINPPQAAILAIGAIMKKPVVNEKNEIVAGQRMSVSLSCDHRVVDGAVGAEYLNGVRKLLENPALMLF